MTRWLAIAALAGSALLVSSTPAQALAREGEAVVVDGNGRPLRGGTTGTEFTLRLPEGAECQGDSQDGNYRVQSFFVPPRVEPGSLKYHFDAPDGEGNQPLWDVFTNPYMQALTGVAKQKGGPGPIANTPLFSFAVYTPRLDLIPSGRYRTGLACTLHNKTTRYWETELRVVTDPAQPMDRQIVWSVAAAPSSSASGAPTPPAALAAGGAVAVGLVAWRLRARRSPS